MNMVVAAASVEFFEMAASAEGVTVILLIIGGIVAAILGRN